MDKFEQYSIYVALALVTYVLAGFTYRHFVRSGKNLITTYGNTAIVTGATDGIGKAIAFELAKRRVDLILISRTESKLREVQQEIQAKYAGAKIELLPIDFANFGAAECSKVSELIKQRDVGILVNNVGLSYSYPDYLHNLTLDNVQQLLDLNIKSATLLTHTVLQRMVQRKKGLIVNLSSAAAVLPAPLLAVYGASKKYVDKLTDALAVEYAGHGIQFQVQNPLYVATKMAKMRPSLQTPTPAVYARAAVNAFGYERHISPYWVHAIMLGVAARLPAVIAEPYVNGMHKSIRARALKKQGAAKKE